MNHFEKIQRDLEEIHITEGLFRYFRLTDYHRDFEIIIKPHSTVKKLRILLRGVVSVDYKSIPKMDSFKMDDAYVMVPIPTPVKGFYWGIKDFEIRKYSLSEKTDKILSMQKEYKFKLYSLIFEVSTAKIEFIFHDIEMEVLEWY